MATLIRVDQTYEIPERLPVVALRDLVYFPYMVLPLLIGRPRSLAALHAAEEGEGYILLLAQKNVQVEDPSKDDLHRVGVVAKVLQVSRLPDGNARVVLEGIGRCRVRRFLKSNTIKLKISRIFSNRLRVSSSFSSRSINEPSLVC